MIVRVIMTRVIVVVIHHNIFVVTRCFEVHGNVPQLGNFVQNSMFNSFGDLKQTR